MSRGGGGVGILGHGRGEGNGEEAALERARHRAGRGEALVARHEALEHMQRARRRGGSNGSGGGR